MASEHAQAKYSDPKQRLAVAYSLSRHRNKKRIRKGLRDYSYKLAAGLAALDGPQAKITTDGSRMSARCTFASTKRDRQGDVLEVSGINTSAHRELPIILLDHGLQWPCPIGVARDPNGNYTVSIDSDLGEAVQETFFSQSSSVAEQVFGLIDEAIMTANSIGFRPIKWSRLPIDWNNGQTSSNKHLHDVELVEISWVGVPANPECIMPLLTGGKLNGKRLAPCIKSMLEPYRVPLKAMAGGVELKGNAKPVNGRVDPEINPTFADANVYGKSEALSATNEVTGGALVPPPNHKFPDIHAQERRMGTKGAMGAGIGGHVGAAIGHAVAGKLGSKIGRTVGRTVGHHAGEIVGEGVAAHSKLGRDVVNKLRPKKKGLAGGAAGATAGGLLGSIVPGIGTATGAIVGGTLGAIGGKGLKGKGLAGAVGGGTAGGIAGSAVPVVGTLSGAAIGAAGGSVGEDVLKERARRGKGMQGKGLLYRRKNPLVLAAPLAEGAISTIAPQVISAGAPAATHLGAAAAVGLGAVGGYAAGRDTTERKGAIGAGIGGAVAGPIGATVGGGRGRRLSAAGGSALGGGAGAVAGTLAGGPVGGLAGEAVGSAVGGYLGARKKGYAGGVLGAVGGGVAGGVATGGNPIGVGAGALGGSAVGSMLENKLIYGGSQSGKPKKKHIDQLERPMDTDIKAEHHTDEELEREAGPDQAGESPEAEEMAHGEELHSASTLRNLHADIARFHDAYEPEMKRCEHPEIKEFLGEFLEGLRNAFDKVVETFDRHHPDSEPLGEKTEGEGEDEEEGVDVQTKGEKTEGEGEDEEEGIEVRTKTMGQGEDDEEGVPVHTGRKSYDVFGKGFNGDERRRLQEVHGFLEEMHGNDGHRNTVRLGAKACMATIKDMLAPYQHDNHPPGEAEVAHTPGVARDARPHTGKGTKKKKKKHVTPEVMMKDAISGGHVPNPAFHGETYETAGRSDRGEPNVGKSLNADERAAIEQIQRAIARRKEIIERHFCETA